MTETAFHVAFHLHHPLQPEPMGEGRVNRSQQRSDAELARLVTDAVNRICGLPRPGLWFNVNQVDTAGRPPESIRVWATLHFSESGSPFCCGEPSCHIGLSDERLRAVSEDVRRQMGLIQRVAVVFEHIAPQYYAGVDFKYDNDVVDDEAWVRLLRESLRNLALPADEQCRTNSPGCIACELMNDFDDARMMALDNAVEMTQVQRELLDQIDTRIRGMEQADFECFNNDVIRRPAWQLLRDMAGNALRAFGW